MKYVGHTSSTREIQGIVIHVQEFVWDNGSRTWEVGTFTTSLTGGEVFSHEPTDDEIIDLLKAHTTFWCCQGCGVRYQNKYGVLNETIEIHKRQCLLYRFAQQS